MFLCYVKMKVRTGLAGYVNALTKSRRLYFILDLTSPTITPALHESVVSA
jgi:hypothetical protein